MPAVEPDKFFENFSESVLHAQRGLWPSDDGRLKSAFIGLDALESWRENEWSLG